MPRKNYNNIYTYIGLYVMFKMEKEKRKEKENRITHAHETPTPPITWTPKMLTKPYLFPAVSLPRLSLSFFSTHELSPSVLPKVNASSLRNLLPYVGPCSSPSQCSMPLLHSPRGLGSCSPSRQARRSTAT
jgi:hypothetical protein